MLSAKSDKKEIIPLWSVVIAVFLAFMVICNGLGIFDSISLEQFVLVPVSYKEGPPIYSTSHNVPLTTGDAENYFRACLDKAIRSGLANGGKFDWNELNQYGFPWASSALNMTCYPENRNWVNICNQQYGYDQCSRMMADIPREEYNAIMHGLR